MLGHPLMLRQMKRHAKAGRVRFFLSQQVELDLA